MRWMGLTVVLWTLALTSPASVEQVRMRHGEFRAWHANGQLAEVRRYVDGRESGLQQSWTPEGVLFLNYEVRDGRRYGLVNSKPCLPAGDGDVKEVM